LPLTCIVHKPGKQSNTLFQSVKIQFSSGAAPLGGSIARKSDERFGS